MDNSMTTMDANASKQIGIGPTGESPHMPNTLPIKPEKETLKKAVTAELNTSFLQHRSLEVQYILLNTWSYYADVFLVIHRCCRRSTTQLLCNQPAAWATQQVSGVLDIFIQDIFRVDIFIHCDHIYISRIHVTCWLRQHFSFLSRNSQNCVVPRGRLGSQTLCPYRVLPWNPRPGGRPGYFINVFSLILLRHSIFGLVYFTSIFPFIIIFCHLIFTQLLLIIVQTLCTISVLLNLSKVNLPYIISILLLRHGLQT